MGRYLSTFILRQSLLVVLVVMVMVMVVAAPSLEYSVPTYNIVGRTFVLTIYITHVAPRQQILSFAGKQSLSSLQFIPQPLRSKHAVVIVTQALSSRSGVSLFVLGGAFTTAIAVSRAVERRYVESAPFS